MITSIRNTYYPMSNAVFATRSGKGVLVGPTRIGNVYGYDVIDGKPVAVLEN